MTRRQGCFRLICTAGVLFFVSCRPHAPDVADPRSPNEKAWDNAHKFEVERRSREAGSAYLALCGKTPPFVRACFDYARVMYETASLDEARAVSVQTVIRFPDAAGAQSLIKRLARSYVSENRAAEGAAALLALGEKVQKTESWDTVIYEVARSARRGGDFPAEKKYLEMLVKAHGRWESQLWDNAVWRLSRICRAENKKDEELFWLDTLLEERESSRIIGSYMSPFHDDALYRLGEIYAADKKFEDARRVFLELGDVRTSRLHDDGLLGAAKADIAQGNLKRACAVLREIVELDGSAKREAAATAESIHCAR